MTIRRLLTRLHRAAGGHRADLLLYAAAAVFALITARTSTLPPHRAWGAIAFWAYAVGLVLASAQFLAYRRRTTPHPSSAPRPDPHSLVSAYALVGNRARATLAWLVGGAAALLPLIVEAVQRAGERTDRAQEEVLVVEQMGERLLHGGTPYLARDAIAALPADERLMAYSPYQPAMAVFGLPRALAGNFWWTDARIWFAIVTVAALAGAAWLAASARTPSALSTRPTRSPSLSVLSPPSTGSTPPFRLSSSLVRAVQSVTVLPICALTLATGGDDLPVLALCLLALALTTTDRYGWAGVAVGLAAAGKLFALPAAAVLIVLALVARRGRRLLPGALGLPIAVLIPPFLIDADAVTENVLRFPLGHGLVTSPAQSPFPGYLIAQNAPGGRYIAAALLVAAGLTITARIVRRPPRTSAAAALLIGGGLLAAILLMPTTRFGYLLYPIAFLTWAAALRKPATTKPPATSAASCASGEPPPTTPAFSASKNPAPPC